MVFSGGSRISRWGGGCRLIGGGTNLQPIHILVKMYAKMKEMDPFGGHAPAAPPGSANGIGARAGGVGEVVGFVSGKGQ